MPASIGQCTQLQLQVFVLRPADEDPRTQTEDYDDIQKTGMTNNFLSATDRRDRSADGHVASQIWA